ncbi:MAG: class II glutamine amidotransferase [candidate division WOR-3 bacterium]
MFVAAAGRFQMNQVVDAVLAEVRPEAEPGGWGIAYCYGNRLELTRSTVPCRNDPEFLQLAERRTDMMVLVPDNRPGILAREIQPFVRREARQTWAFCHQGQVVCPDELDTGNRWPDSDSPSEKLFLHVLSRFDKEAPVETATAALRGLNAEKGLSCCLIGSEIMLAASWSDSDQEHNGLWYGRGELVLYVSGRPLRSLPDIEWEPAGSHSVIAIRRTRREVT